MESLEYVYALRKHGMKLGLENMQRMAALLDHPERSYGTVHVAGTNGKGSTVAMLESILRTAGRRTGRFTSPHLFRFNERIVADGEEIADAGIDRLVRDLRAVTEAHGTRATFFEFVTMMAFLHFARSGVDYAVLETGLGGRLDATNIVQPELSIITSIAKDHEKHLGDSLCQIAEEKAGIIKPGCPVLVAQQREDVLATIRAVAAERNAPLSVIAPDTTLEVPLRGAHQVQNASLAVAAAGHLGVSQEDIATGLSRAEWPGRLQTLSERPLVIVDGAHNPAGLRALKRSLPDDLQTLVFAASDGKPYGEMLAAIASGFSRIIVTQPVFKKGDAAAVAEEAIRHAEIVVEEDVAKAVALALERPGVLITGSLYMIGGAILAVRDALPAMSRIPGLALRESS